MSSTVQIETSLLEALFSSIVAHKEKTQPVVEVQTPSIVKDVAAIASKISDNEEINRYFRGHYKFGAAMRKIKDDVNNLVERPDAPKAVNKIINQFNQKPQVVLTRTHGRTTFTEQLEMAVFAKCINPTYVAHKFSVSLPTVYLYAKTYGHLV
jgi:hypothetical protein